MALTIYTFPFAGGSKYSYNLYRRYLPADIHFEPLELPGRGERITDDLVPNLEQMAEELYQEIKGNLPDRFIFYGHSMGTLLAYLITKKLQEANEKLPFHLILTGAAGPSNEERERDRHQLPKAAFKAKLEEYGGSPSEVLENTELFDFFEPILRNDFKAVETYSYKEILEKLPIPITTIYGMSEQLTREEVQLWERETSESFEVRQLPGGHFFIFDYPAEVVKTILNKVYA